MSTKSGLSNEAAVRSNVSSSNFIFGDHRFQSRRQNSRRFRVRPLRPRSVLKYHLYHPRRSLSGGAGVLAFAMSCMLYPPIGTSPRTRSGQSAATMHAARPPQSNPTKNARSISSASRSPRRSCPSAACWPLRKDSAPRNCVGPNPRRYGTTVRKPCSTSSPATPSHARTSSGNPCSSTTGIPSPGPLSSYAMRNETVSTCRSMLPRLMAAPSSSTLGEPCWLKGVGMSRLRASTGPR